MNNIIKNTVKMVEPICPKFKFSIENTFPTKEIIITIIDNKAKVLIDCSFNKSSGSINSFGNFFLTISFKIAKISLFISVMLIPLDSVGLEKQGIQM